MVNSSEEIKSMVEKQAEEIDQLRRKLKQEHEEKMERVSEKKWTLKVESEKSATCCINAGCREEEGGG